MQLLCYVKSKLLLLKLVRAVEARLLQIPLYSKAEHKSYKFEMVKWFECRVSPIVSIKLPGEVLNPIEETQE
jgi:hypothetical protein